MSVVKWSETQGGGNGIDGANLPLFQNQSAAISGGLGEGDLFVVNITGQTYTVCTVWIPVTLLVTAPATNGVLVKGQQYTASGNLNKMGAGNTLLYFTMSNNDQIWPLAETISVAGDWSFNFTVPSNAASGWLSFKLWTTIPTDPNTVIYEGAPPAVAVRNVGVIIS